MKLFLLGFVVLSVALGASGELCAQAQSQDVCVVSAEDGQTCAWCRVGSNDKSVSVCLNRDVAGKMDLLEDVVSCDVGDNDVLTRMPVMEGLKRTEPLGEPNADYIPVVLMHGIGDSGHNPGMKNIAKSIMDAYPGLYATSVDVADGLSGYTTDIGKQVDSLAATVRADEKLANGFNLVGLSQGGIVVRAYTQVYNDPPVHRLISMCGVLEGVGDCPGGTPNFLCNLVKDRVYNAPVSFAGYWKNANDKDKYMAESKHLVYWNNEKDFNSTFKANMIALDKYVLVKALNDTVVYPHESEDHGFYAWGDTSTIVRFNETEGYQKDLIGLKTLDSAKKVDHYSYIGNHLRWSSEFWTDTIMPYFNATFEEWNRKRAAESRITAALQP